MATGERWLGGSLSDEKSISQTFLLGLQELTNFLLLTAYFRSLSSLALIFFARVKHTFFADILFNNV